MTFAEKLKAIRLKMGISQQTLAKILEVSPGAVGNWETGNSQPWPSKMESIASKLGVDYSDLVDESVCDVEPMRDEGAPLYNTKGIVPVISWARAGDAADYGDLGNHIEQTVPSDWPDPNAFALVIEGDSMEPEIQAGDISVISPRTEPRNGDLVVARFSEEAEPAHGVVFKRFTRTGPEGTIIRLTSTNPNYGAIEMPRKKILWIYPAVQLIRRLRTL